jgi:thymidine phosphorylase
LKPGEALLTIHYNDGAKLSEVTARVTKAWHVGEAAPARRPLVLERLT